MKTSWLGLAAGTLLTLVGCVTGNSTEKIPPVRPFDVQRYLGTWYEIARLPHSFEHGMDFVSATYTLDPAGFIRVENRGTRDGEVHAVQGRAYFSGDADTGELRVSFFRPFYGDYRIIRLAPDYSYAVVTSSTDSYFWILARTPQLDAELLRELVAQAQEWGFATDQLIFPKQNKPINTDTL